MGGVQVAGALRKLGASVFTQHEVFQSRDILPQDEKDEVWLAECGKQQWFVVTKDHRLKSRQLELEALVSAGVGVFVWKDANATGPDMCAAFTKLYAKMVKAAQKYLPPFLLRIGLNGEVTPMPQLPLRKRAAVKKSSEGASEN
jgi:hypothetical protein